MYISALEYAFMTLEANSWKWHWLYVDTTSFPCARSLLKLGRSNTSLAW